MKILHVYSEDDYAATMAEEYGIEKIVKKCKDTNEVFEFQEGRYGEILEFGDVDKEFVEFIRDNIQDYDMSKDENFWVLEE